MLTPPDVDFISDFSKNVKLLLWGIFTDSSFVKEMPSDTQKVVMSTLTGLGITPTTEQLLKYLELQKQGSINQEILDKLSILQESVIDLKNKKNDIIDFKPNFYRIGVNGNEVFRRLLKIRKKTNK